MQHDIRKHAKGLLLLALLSSNAFALMPQARTTSWNGLNVGAQLGGGWAHSDWSYTGANYFNTPFNSSQILGTDFRINGSGALAGGFIGFQSQMNHLVIGIEAAISGADLDDDISSPYFPTEDTYTTDVRWYSTVKARFGYADDQWLAYIAGGWAGADVKLDLNDYINVVNANNTKWTNGWVIGAGFDYKIMPCLAVGIAYEYIHLDDNNESVTCPACSSGPGFGTPIVDGDTTLQTVVARVSYLFNL